MVPQQAGRSTDRDQTNKEQGTAQRKLMVNKLFKHEMNLIEVVGLLTVTKEELDKAACGDNGQCLKAKLELSPKKRAGEKRKSCFRGLEEGTRDLSTSDVFPCGRGTRRQMHARGRKSRESRLVYRQRCSVEIMNSF